MSQSYGGWREGEEKRVEGGVQGQEGRGEGAVVLGGRKHFTTSLYKPHAFRSVWKPSSHDLRACESFPVPSTSASSQRNQLQNKK